MEPSFLLLGCERVDQFVHEILTPTKIQSCATYSCWIHCQRCSEVLASFSLELDDVCKPHYTFQGYPEEDYFVVESKTCGLKTQQPNTGLHYLKCPSCKLRVGVVDSKAGKTCYLKSSVIVQDQTERND